MAWSDSGQITQSILGIKGMEQQKKNDRWSKLMDIANVLQNTAGLGADIWKTISGRKYGTEERIASQQYADTSREDTQAHDETMNTQRSYLDKALADKNAELDEAKANNDQGRAMALQKEIARLQSERDKTLHGYAMEEISAGQGSDASQQRITKMRTAITEGLKAAVELRPDWFVPDPRDPSGQSFVPNPQTVNELRENIVKAIMMERPSQSELDAVMPYLEDLLSGKAGSVPGMNGATVNVNKGTGKSSIVELGELKKSYQSMFRNLANAEKALNDGYPRAADDLYRAQFGNVVTEMSDFNIPIEELEAARMAVDAIQPTGKTIQDQSKSVKKMADIAKETIDNILKKYKLLNEVFAPSGP